MCSPGGGLNPKWKRTKANLRSGGKLKIVTGPVNIEALEDAAKSLHVIRDYWYLGRLSEITEATN